MTRGGMSGQDNSWKEKRWDGRRTRELKGGREDGMRGQENWREDKRIGWEDKRIEMTTRGWDDKRIGGREDGMRGQENWRLDERQGLEGKTMTKGDEKPQELDGR